MAWTDDLLAGVANYLHGQGVCDWAPDAPIEALTRPAIIGPVVDQPDLMLGLILFGSVDDPNSSESLARIQFWIRGDHDLDTVNEWGDELFDALHGATDVQFGGIPCLLVARRSHVLVGRDQASRWETAHNYDFQVTRGNAFRPE